MNVSCRLIKIFDEYTVDKNLKTSYQSIVKLLMYIMLKIVASSDTEAELRDHVM
jgi:hypothetical protein